MTIQSIMAGYCTALLSELEEYPAGTPASIMPEENEPESGPWEDHWAWLRVSYGYDHYLTAEWVYGGPTQADAIRALTEWVEKESD